MTEKKPATEPCYAQRLFVPFVELLAGYPQIPAAVLDQLRAMGPDERVPIARAHAMLEAAVQVTGDPHLGLKAGRSMVLGDGGALDYAVRSAPTVRAAVECAARYLRLVNDGVALRLDQAGGRAMLRFETDLAMPPAAEDFMLSTLFSQHPGLRSAPNAEVWLRQPAPADPGEHLRTFAPVPVRFSAAVSGCAFDESHLERPLATADHKLHSVIREHAERMLAELPRDDGTSERVRGLIANRLSQGQPSVREVAQALDMSTRTLARRLAEEGTSFTELVDDVRRRLALQYLTSPKIALSEVGFLLGFAHGPAFHRAFKRWTGQTPLEYRRSQRRFVAG